MMNTYVSRFPVLALFLVVGGCSAMGFSGGQTRTGVSSSLVDYLYPNGEVPPDFEAQIPRFNLPLRVGLAFVPSAWSGANGPSEATKIEVLDQVKQSFAGKEYIEHIEVIPDTYLRSSNGFDGMQQVARLYGVDVMALVSYDQVSATGENTASVLYWTIVGAYFIKGTENEIQTFVDTAVFDVSSRKLLFRAPGTDKRQSKSTLVENTEQLRKSQELGFRTAMNAMTENLSGELVKFEERLAEDPTVAEATWQEGKSGGGAFSQFFLAMLAACVSWRRRTNLMQHRPDRVVRLD